jgi:hypothetical protein
MVSDALMTTSSPEAEEVQELGREGVGTIKRWLESTTHIELPWDVYHQRPSCTVVHLAGRKSFDLCGHFLTGDKDLLHVECKRYKTPGRQYKEFQKFLAISYSSAVKEIEELGADRKRHFLWVTYHPFSLEHWASLETHEEMAKALKEYPELLPPPRMVDQNLLRAVANRTMVLVFNAKQEDISLTRDELQKVRTVLDRKGRSL